MRFTIFTGFVLAATALTSPLLGGDTALLSPRDVSIDSTANCQDIVYGATSAASGKTCVGIAGGTLTVTANVAEGWTLNDVHVVIGTTKPTITQPGQFPYGTHKGSCTKAGLTATCAIPLQPDWRICDQPLYIAVHVAATTPTGAQETGWGRGSCYDTKGNCAKYWSFMAICSCPFIYDYEPITTTKTYVTTITTSKAYTVTFPSVHTTEVCNDPYVAQTTSHSLKTTTLPATWEPPMERK